MPPACSFYHCRVPPAPTPEVALLLGMAWAAEGHPALPPRVLARLAAAFPGDVRAALMNLQAWAPALPALAAGGAGGAGGEVVVVDDDDEEEEEEEKDEAGDAKPAATASADDGPVAAAAGGAAGAAGAAAGEEEEEPGQEQEEKQPEEEEEWQGDAQATAEAVAAAAAQAAREAAEDARALVVLGCRVPLVLKAEPCTGRPEGGQRLRVLGRRFLQRAPPAPASASAAGEEEGGAAAVAYAPVTVLLGHTPCTDVHVLSDTELLATTPPCPSGPQAEAGPSVLPLVVRVGRFAASSAVVAPPAFRYRIKGRLLRGGGQRRIDDMLFKFPELHVAGGMLGKGKGKAGKAGKGPGRGKKGKGGRRLVRPAQEVEGGEEEELVLEDGEAEAEAAPAVGDGEEESVGSGGGGQEEGEEERSPKGSKRRRIVVDEEEEDEDEEGGGDDEASAAAGVSASASESGASTPAKREEEATSPVGSTETEMAAEAAIEKEGDEEESVAAAVEEEDEQEEEEEEEEEEEVELPSELPQRVWRDVLWCVFSLWSLSQHVSILLSMARRGKASSRCTLHTHPPTAHLPLPPPPPPPSSTPPRRGPRRSPAGPCSPRWRPSSTATTSGSTPRRPSARGRRAWRMPR